MKKTISLVLAVLMLMGIMSTAVQAEGNIEITKASAADGATSAPVSALLTYTFSEDIADMEAADVSLVVAGQPTELVKEVAVSGNVLKVRTSAKLSYGTDYSLDLTKVKAAADENKKLEDGVITFKTKPGSKETVLEDNFESGALDGSWRANSTAIVQKENDGGNYSYQLKSSANMDNFIGTVSAMNLNGEVLIGFDMLFDEAVADYNTIFFVGNNSVKSQIKDTDGVTNIPNPEYKNFESMRLLGYDKETGRFGVLFNSTTSTSIPAAPIASEPVKSGWNKILMKVDLPNQSIQLYVNGVKVKDENGNSDFLFPKNVGNATFAEIPLTIVRFNKVTEGNIYVDNVYYREAQVQTHDSSVMTLTASTPSFEKAVKDIQKEFILTYNHEINNASFENVLINGTAVKSTVVNGNTVTVTIPDNYKLEEDTEYTFDFVGAEDVYGCSIPNATFRTKTNYNIYKMDFEDGIASDDELWNLRDASSTGNPKDERSSFGVMTDPLNSENKVYGLKQFDSDSLRLESKWFLNKTLPDFGVDANKTVLSFKMNYVSMTGKTGVNSKTGEEYEYNDFLEFAYRASAIGETNVAKTAGRALRFYDNGNGTYKINFKNYSNGYFVDSTADIDFNKWVTYTYEFDFDKQNYVVYVDDAKFGPYGLPSGVDSNNVSKEFYAIDGMRFQSMDASETELYVDDIVVGQKFFADTDYDMGFYNSNGEATDVVDTVKTTYKVTAVNRGKTNDSTKLILVVTDVEENRVSEVRLVDFAEKNEKDEIVIEENFTEDLEGKKIKAFYWQDFGSLSPVLSETRFEGAEVLPVSAE